MPVIRIEQPKVLDLAGAPSGANVGATRDTELDAADYEVRCTAPVRLRLGKTSAVSPTDLIVLPEAPVEVQLSGTVSCAAATPFAARVFFVPLRRKQ